MFPTQRRIVLAAVLAAFACSAIAQQQPAAKGGKHHTLPATLETVQWGWLDPKEPPKLTVNSGDTVSIETMMHAHNKVQQGITMEQIVELRKANPGGGPHSMTGPIYVNGAEPGDVMEIRILKIVPKSFGITFNLPGKDFPTIGALAPERHDGLIKFWSIDPAKKSAEFKPGIQVELQPFPGTLAVGIDPNDPSPRKGGVKDDPMAPVSTLRPWKNGSNMDINEMTEGTTIFIPVFLEGGLIWTGDSHCLQGNGEVNLTALECSYKEIELQPIVRPVEEGDDGAGQCPPCDEPRREEAARADVLAPMRSGRRPRFGASPAIDDSLDGAADEDRKRGGERQIGADREGERRDAAQLD